jgi:hypothetical protein
VSRSILDFSRMIGQRRFGAKIRLRVPTSVLPGKQFQMPLNYLSGFISMTCRMVLVGASMAREGWAGKIITGIPVPFSEGARSPNFFR